MMPAFFHSRLGLGRAARRLLFFRERSEIGACVIGLADILYCRREDAAWVLCPEIASGRRLLHPRKRGFGLLSGRSFDIMILYEPGVGLGLGPPTRPAPLTV